MLERVTRGAGALLAAAVFGSVHAAFSLYWAWAVAGSNGVSALIWWSGSTACVGCSSRSRC